MVFHPLTRTKLGPTTPTAMRHTELTTTHGLLAQDVDVNPPDMGGSVWIWLLIALFFVVVFVWVLRKWYVGGKNGPPWFRH